MVLLSYKCFHPLHHTAEPTDPNHHHWETGFFWIYYIVNVLNHSGERTFLWTSLCLPDDILALIQEASVFHLFKSSMKPDYPNQKLITAEFMNSLGFPIFFPSYNYVLLKLQLISAVAKMIFAGVNTC